MEDAHTCLSLDVQVSYHELGHTHCSHDHMASVLDIRALFAAAPSVQGLLLPNQIPQSGLVCQA